MLPRKKSTKMSKMLRCNKSHDFSKLLNTKKIRTLEVCTAVCMLIYKMRHLLDLNCLPPQFNAYIKIHPQNKPKNNHSTTPVQALVSTEKTVAA